MVERMRLSFRNSIPRPFYGANLVRASKFELQSSLRLLLANPNQIGPGVNGAETQIDWGQIQTS